MTVTAVVYTDAGITPYDDVGAAKAAQGTTWIRADSPTPDELAAVRDAFGIHPLAVEDVQNGVRPKTEEFDTHTVLLVTDARFRAGETTFEQELDTRPVGLFIGTDWVVTLTHDDVDAIDATWDAVLREDARILSRGPDFTAYRVLDRIVDDYFALLDGIEDQIEAIEGELVDATRSDLLDEINDVRRELLAVRKLLWPTRDAISGFARGDPSEVAVETEKYYRDVYDHVVQQVDLVETYRDLASSSRDIYLNALSQSTNEVMKRLTVVATIVLPLTFIVGVYGMNFETMPELGWPYAYHATLLGMILLSAILVWYFRGQDWL
ncbi:magnesium/cobalt transporter CorA [Salarchaeum sp. JOR-1]|uniref:magnesium/cobalt transporter CorA n=1 Tax=Salarchaeum sp. JOR-1 TaxID=2599399 RepID=UPI001198610C|nr:magnesium/cobalt transporter CorA [Salarchaeum sp. JOR-1]QDX41277.1 magnesium/cobalt transporter CorA [Salarchaeum sp. JOR-1]